MSPLALVPIQIDARSRFQAYFEHVIGQVNMGGQPPVSSLMISPSCLTKASSDAAMELVERKVLAGQRHMKLVVEREIFDLVVEQAGCDPQRVGVRLEWGMLEKPEIVVADLIKAAELQLIRVEEFRNIMKGVGWELTETKTSGKTIAPQGKKSSFASLSLQ